MGGDIKVTMTGDPAKGKRDVYLSSMGGDITLAVPSGLSMDIHIELCYTKSSRKDYKIVSDFKIQQEEKDDWHKGKGSHKKCIYGKAKIKDAKHKIKIKTINGNVYLKEN